MTDGMPLANSTPRVRFEDYLPEVFVTGGTALIGTDAGQAAADFLRAFLTPFETLFEELQGEIEGTAATPGAAPQQGGIPDLFAPALTPPIEFAGTGTATEVAAQPGQQVAADAQSAVDAQFVADTQSAADARAYEFLSYLADWIGVALRPERPVSWNREFLGQAVPLNLLRGTLAGLEALLRAWLSGDLLTTDPPLLIVTDLTRTVNDATTVFQLNETAMLGVQTVLGEGPPFWFVVDLIADPSVPVLRNPVGIDVLQRATRALLAAEKPAHTYYQLRIRTTTMQLAPAAPADQRPGEIYAQLEDDAGTPPLLGTALLWDDPWVFDSDPQSGTE